MRMRVSNACSNFNHLKIFFAGTAVRAEPVIGYIFPARTRGDSFFGTAFLFLVHPSADDAHPNFEFFATFSFFSHYFTRFFNFAGMKVA